jgi:hypothetical protein
MELRQLNFREPDDTQPSSGKTAMITTNSCYLLLQQTPSGGKVEQPG